MKYSTILPAFLFLAGSALLPISSYADSCDQDAPTVASEDSGVESTDGITSDDSTS